MPTEEEVHSGFSTVDHRRHLEGEHSGVVRAEFASQRPARPLDLFSSFEETILSFQLFVYK